MYTFGVFPFLVPLTPNTEVIFSNIYCFCKKRSTLPQRFCVKALIYHDFQTKISFLGIFLALPEFTRNSLHMFTFCSHEARRLVLWWAD